MTARCSLPVLALFTATWLACAAVPARADDSPGARQVAAERYLQLVPVVPMIEATVAGLSQQVPERVRSEWVGQMRVLVDKRAIAAAVRDAMVQTYTTDEIQALVDFYSSRHGASIVAKGPAYNALIQPALLAAVRRSAERVLEARR